jgi:hypothetical protein
MKAGQQVRDSITCIEVRRWELANKFNDQSTDQIINEHQVKPDPHKLSMSTK